MPVSTSYSPVLYNVGPPPEQAAADAAHAGELTAFDHGVDGLAAGPQEFGDLVRGEEHWLNGGGVFNRPL